MVSRLLRCREIYQEHLPRCTSPIMSNRPTLFIADLHLDPTRPAITNLFLKFLNEQALECSALYILGDLFEVWIGDDDPEPAHATVIDAIRATVDAGVPVFLLHGNRDFLISDDFLRRSATTLLPDPTVIDLHGKPTLISHGDGLCTDDIDYQAFRTMVRDTAWQNAFLEKTIEERQAIARQLRETSMTQTRNKADDIMDVNPQAVRDAFINAQVTRMIHGHTHRPAIHDMDINGKHAQRIVVGDWYEQGSVLICDEQTCDLRSLAPDENSSNQVPKD